MPLTPDRRPGALVEEEIQFENQASDPTVNGALRRVGKNLRYRDSDGTTSTLLLEASRALIQFIEDGPTQGFASGAFYEETSSLSAPFNTILPTDIVWWVSSAKTQKIVEKVITWDTANQRPTQILWRVYDADGTTVLATVTDAYSYAGTFPSRTRTIS